MTSFGKIVAVALLALPLTAFAVTTAVPAQSAFITADVTPKQSVVSAFRQYLSVSPNISVPTVLGVPITSDLVTIPTVAVYNLTTNTFEPALLKVSKTLLPTPSQVTAIGAVGNTYAIQDNNYQTYLEFPLREGANKAELTFTFNKPIVASSLTFALDANVALPQTISVTYQSAQGIFTILAPVRLYETTVRFPQTTASVWHVSFDYVQPLRITEMRFNEDNPNSANEKSVRFLAQPGQSYQVYVGADRYVASPTREAGDLSTDRGVVMFTGAYSTTNPSYTPADADADGIPDLTDNCTSLANADQKDSDSNGRGDACEDYDRDGVMSANDNCPLIPNQAQVDTDADSVGDDCDNFDNRITERMPWLPWAGIGIAGVVLLGLFILAFKYKKEDVSDTPNIPSNPA